MPTTHVTAFFIYVDEPSHDLEVGLSNLESSAHWDLVRVPADSSVAVSFRVIKVPALVTYNGRSEETGRVFGSQNIKDLIKRILG